MSANRCDKCNRKLKDPHAQYGWRCAQILGITKALNYAGDEAYVVYQAGILSAKEFLEAHPEIHLSDEAVLSFYESVGKAALAHGMKNDMLYKQAMHEVCSILGCEGEQEHNEILQGLSLEDYLWLKDQQDYLNGRYDTDGLLDETPDGQMGALQKRMNSSGYTDRFGNPLKEDGVAGPRTEWATDVVRGVVPLTQINLLHPRHTNIGIFKTNEGIDGVLGNINLADTSRMNARLFSFDKHKYRGMKDYTHINTGVRSNSSALQVEVANWLDHKQVPKPVYNALKDFDKVKNFVKKGGKALAVIGAVFDAVELGTTINEDLNDEDGKLGKKTVSTAAGIAGGWGGGALGAKAGAFGGAAIGTAICPGLGTVIGGFLGGLIGGIVGAFAGREGATALVDVVW